MDKTDKKARRRSLREDAANLPNMLTMGRIVVIPWVLWLMWQDTRVANFWACIVFSAAAVTDFIDGYLARRMGLTSLLGKYLDPLADKLIVIGTLVMCVELGRVPAWAIVVIVSRELAITALRALAIGERVEIVASRGGKDKTAIQMVAVVTLILDNTYIFDFGLFRGVVDLNAVGLVMLYISVLFTVFSGGEYIALFAEAVEAKDKRIKGEDE